MHDENNIKFNFLIWVLFLLMTQLLCTVKLCINSIWSRTDVCCFPFRRTKPCGNYMYYCNVKKICILPIQSILAINTTTLLNTVTLLTFLMAEILFSTRYEMKFYVWLLWSLSHCCVCRIIRYRLRFGFNTILMLFQIVRLRVSAITWSSSGRLNTLKLKLQS